MDEKQFLLRVLHATDKKRGHAGAGIEYKHTYAAVLLVDIQAATQLSEVC